MESTVNIEDLLVDLGACKGKAGPCISCPTALEGMSVQTEVTSNINLPTKVQMLMTASTKFMFQF
jgi:hypothetical protein